MLARRCLLAWGWIVPLLASSFAAAQVSAAPLSAQPGPGTPAYPHARNTPLRQQIATLLAGSQASGAHWGIAVTTLNGTPLLGWNEQQLFRAASTAKLFTTAAALSLLGPDHTVATTIQGDLDRATGIVNGDLTLVGAGDPSFGTADLPFGEHPASDARPDTLGDLADRLAAMGVKHITGDVVGDDTLFAQEPPPEGWAAEDLLWGYGALPSALTLDDNQIRLRITAPLVMASGPQSTPPADTPSPAVTLEQRVPWIQVAQGSHLTAAAEGSDRFIAIEAVPGAPQAVRVFGTMPSGGKPDLEELAVTEPAAYAAAAFRQLLLERGIEVDGQSHAVHTPAMDPRSFLQRWRDPDDASAPVLPGGAAPCPIAGTPPQAHITRTAAQILVSIPSAPLQDEVTFTLKTSANLHAELLLRQLALSRACGGVSGVLGAAIVRRWLLGIGLPEQDFVLYDGSGLSAKDLVTPRLEAALLAWATTQPWFGTWESALPVGGVDGTLANRFTAPPLRGRIAAKTGTLGESRALAGYVQCHSGRKLIVAVLVDNHQPGNAADRATMDAIIAAIAATL